MDPLSKKSFPSRRKKVSPPWGPPGTKHRVYTEDDQGLFFEAFARLGTITAAAKELEFKKSTCQMWAQSSEQETVAAYSAEQKTEFFEVLDRTNNVAQAAKSLGINVQTAFGWAYSTGAVLRKPRTTLTARQQALAPQKAEFLKIMKQVRNVTEASRQAGVKHSQGASWAMAAGIQNVPFLEGKRQEFQRLITRGMTKKAASALVGVDRKTGYRWAHAAETVALGHAKSRETPEVTYNNRVTSNSVEYPDLISIVAAVLEGPELPPVPGPRAMTLQDVERELDPRYLGIREREQIADMLRAGHSIRAIALTLSRSASTVSREIKRNSHSELGTSPTGLTGMPLTPELGPKKVNCRYPVVCVST